jgi:dienelactone hydrolase
MLRSRWLTSFLAPCFGLTLVVSTSDGESPRPTEEPSPPGRSGTQEYPHRSFRSYNLGTGGRSYWLYEPAEPAPARAPVVVFSHGWLAVNPGVYGAWINHLARSGRIVIFPRYQADTFTRPIAFLPNAVAAIRDALDVLEAAPGHVRPDRDRFALIGHSAGGNLSAQLAAVASAEGLPVPRAVVAVTPGEVRPFREPTLDRIPAETRLVVIVADGDLLVGDHRARQIYAEATAVPPSNKEFVLYRTDRHGPWPIIADHVAPCAGLAALDTGEGPLHALQMSKAGVDLLDRHGFWRLADLTLAAGFTGRTLDEATEHGALFRDLGRWSDGRIVTPPLSGDDLAAIPRIFPTNGARVLPWNPEEFLRLLIGTDGRTVTVRLGPVGLPKGLGMTPRE